MSGRGTLFLVVGPSGAGKDSLITAARLQLEPGGRFVFPKRVITRETGDPSEDHVFEDTSAFDAHEQASAFALSWRAHGLAYGIPAAISEDLAQDRCVVVNVSRHVIDDARRRFPRVVVIEVTAPPETLAQRLVARGRESSASIAERMGRAAPIAADAVVVNDGPLERAVADFVRVLSTVETSREAP